MLRYLLQERKGPERIGAQRFDAIHTVTNNVLQLLQESDDNRPIDERWNPFDGEDLEPPPYFMSQPTADDDTTPLLPPQSMENTKDIEL